MRRNMAENDTHYNGTSDMSDNDAAAPLPEPSAETGTGAITATTTGDIMETAGATASCLLLPLTPQFPHVITDRCGS